MAVLVSGTCKTLPGTLEDQRHTTIHVNRATQSCSVVIVSRKILRYTLLNASTHIMLVVPIPGFRSVNCIPIMEVHKEAFTVTC